MDIKITRTCRKPEFDRTPLNQINDIPREDLESVIDQVEIMTDFKSARRKGKCWCTTWFIVLILVLIGTGVSRKYQNKVFERIKFNYSKGYGVDEYIPSTQPEYERKAIKAQEISPSLKQVPPSPKPAPIPEPKNSSKWTIVHLLKSMQRPQINAFNFIMRRNKENLPLKIFTTADQENQSNSTDFGGIFKKEFEDLRTIMHTHHHGKKRGDCHRRHHHRRRHHRKLQVPGPTPEDINKLTGLPHKYDNTVNKLLVKQRDTHW